MDANTGFFYLFALITVFAASRVVTARNPVHSVLFLVLTFVSAAAIWLLLKAEFLAIVLVLVYVGAVMVLFLFVVMMLDINVDKVRHGFWKALPVALFVGAAIVIELSLVLWVQFGPVKSADAPALPPNYSNTAALGQLIYTEYIYPLEIAGVILLVAMVAAIALDTAPAQGREGPDAGPAGQGQGERPAAHRQLDRCEQRAGPWPASATRAPRRAPRPPPLLPACRRQSAPPAPDVASRPAAANDMNSDLTLGLAHYLPSAPSCSRSAWSGSSSTAATSSSS